MEEDKREGKIETGRERDTERHGDRETERDRATETKIKRDLSTDADSIPSNRNKERRTSIVAMATGHRQPSGGAT